MTQAGLRKHWDCVVALRNSKTIQRHDVVDGKWIDDPEPCFFENVTYRIKPAPREWWVNVYPSAGEVYNSRLEADRHAAPTRLACVHVREIL